MLYKGSCHCGKITFEVEGELTGVVSCNCSICSRRGSLLWSVPRDGLKLLTPEEDIATYTFNKHVFVHRFCPTCGVHPYAEDPASTDERMAYINIRCLENVDLTAIPIYDFDGRSV